MTDTREARKIALVEALAERARSTEHRTAKAYLACICGMWTHTLGVTKDPITPKDDSHMRDWYAIGVGASADAARMRETAEAREKAKQEKEKKGIKSLFRLK